MAEIAGFSRDARGRSGVIRRILHALTFGRMRPFQRPRAPRLRTEDWPDYLLRDVGLGGAAVGDSDRRMHAIDRLIR
jgi:hypothetical protein